MMSSTAHLSFVLRVDKAGCPCRLEDQLIIFMALASGTSRMLCQQPTLHTRTAMVVAEQLTSAKFTVIQQNPRLWLIECSGAAIPVGR